MQFSGKSKLFGTLKLKIDQIIKNMETIKKESYWSRFVSDYEEKQKAVVGEEVILLAKKEILAEKFLGNVLELGCGTGLYSEVLVTKATKVLATDFSEEMINTAKQKRAYLKNTEFVQANALNLQFESEFFDTVFMANLIHIIGNAEKVIQESKRMLKKKGTLIITSFAMNEMNFFNQLTMGIRFLKTFGKPPEETKKEKTTKKSIENLLEENGFEISKSIIMGNKSKAFYIASVKK